MPPLAGTSRAVVHVPRTTYHVPRTTYHVPRTTYHVPRTTPYLTHGGRMDAGRSLRAWVAPRGAGAALADPAPDHAPPDAPPDAQQQGVDRRTRRLRATSWRWMPANLACW